MRLIEYLKKRAANDAAAEKTRTEAQAEATKIHTNKR